MTEIDYGPSGEGRTTYREDVLREALERFGKQHEYERLKEWRRERGNLQAKHEGRLKRKVEAAGLDEYAQAWIRSLDRNAYNEEQTLSD